MLIFGSGLFVGLMLIGVPIFIAFLLGGVVICIYHLNLSWIALVTYSVGTIRDYVLLAIPLFILAGNLMIVFGSAERLINFFLSVLKHVPGGLAMVAVVSCTAFGALTGSMLAATVAIGAFMIPEMEKYGYSRGFSAGLVAVAGVLGGVIPPSNIMIVYGCITASSVAKLFIGGIIPGLFMCTMLCGVCYIMSVRGGFGKAPSASWGERWRGFYRAIPCLSIPIVVLGGIYGGVFTPTEAAAVACWMAVICGAMFRQLNLKAFLKAVRSTVFSAVMIFILIASATFLSKVYVYTGIPRVITGMATAYLTPMLFLMTVIAVFLILGVFMEVMPALYIALPTLYPAAEALSISLLHMGVIVTVITGIGMVTPPVAVALYTAASIGEVEPTQVLRGVIPFFLTMVACAIIMVFIPQMVTWLPSLMS